MDNKGSKKTLGTILTVLAVLFGLYTVSPVDLSPAMLGLDDIGSIVAMIGTIVGAVKAFSDKRSGSDKQ